ncbi:iron-containing alcohol dehydrogenase [Gracilibacillus salitolerans]|uniref:Iron-containing alcohol dehydrogenase n=1 Tax=Gracilibacillus salitolerans TaxID=2663022 RepID=A0A5Q2THU5_9BACI|nr:iron-containing alcohol dehydrogenase [Gracilibacillus salitolerans]QGH33510.1 iron-containing alcohol dehydrogenase [Gracilibacillus salitolerans]
MKKIHAFQTVDKIIFGNHSLENLNEHLFAFGEIKHVLIATLPNFEKNLDIVTKQLDELQVTYDVITDIQPEPTVYHLNELYSRIESTSYDLMIGMGGGSILDAVKILSVLKTNDEPLENLIGTELIKNKGVPMVLIPTTSGTGSEVTPNSIVTFPEQELKIGIVSRHFLADLVVLDPMLTVSVPPRITAATGMDAFTHSFESYISNKANPISNMYAMESMKLITQSIVQSYEQGDNIEARSKMLLGATYGGMALTSAGTAAVHALAYPLGGKFKVSHGEANSMLLPHVTRVNLDVIEDKMAYIAKEIGLVEQGSSLSVKETAELLIKQIESWTKQLNIPQNIAEFGVKYEDIQPLALAASKVTRLLNNNPKELSVEDVENIYRKLLD